MSLKYVWLYGMWKIKAYGGPDQPDKPGLSETDEEERIDKEDTFFDGDPSPNPTPPVQITDVWICFGIHVQEPLYVDPAVRKVIRLFDLKEIQTKYPGCTRKQLNSARDAFSIGAFTNASITITAVDPTKVYPMFGKEYATTIAIASCAIVDEMANYFLTEKFQVGPDKAEYRVLPGSFQIKTKRQKPQPIA